VDYIIYDSNIAITVNNDNEIIIIQIRYDNMIADDTIYQVLVIILRYK